MSVSKSSSLFDEIFRLQNPAPDVDIDPEDQDNGLQAALVDGGSEAVESVGSTLLRKRTAFIDNDPKYQGKTTSRKDLYSDGEESLSDVNLGTGDSEKEASDDDGDDESDNDLSVSEEESEEDNVEDQEEEEEKSSMAREDDSGVSVTVPSTKSDDREKGKAVHHQLGIWDELMRSRISLQKVVLASNNLPQHDMWPLFAQSEAFKAEARDVHSTVRKVMAALLDLQQALSHQDKSTGHMDSKEGSDEEITSESEPEDEEDKSKNKTSDDDNECEMEEEEEEADEDAMDVQSVPRMQTRNSKRGKLKRKLDVGDVEETLASRHSDFQDFRNSTLSKWDEKTRLTHGKIRAKNFAAFEMSVLKQIEQVLVNRDRLVRRIHQPRSAVRVLGRRVEEEDKEEEEEGVDDDEEEPEVPQVKKSAVRVDCEIIDDSDFYHVCLRDLLESKHNEELDPVTASRQRLEIQRLRNKQKKKVDTRASKGRKIRYHVKEKLKNYMTPYDKSAWSHQQKDDLFKAVFGGHHNQQTNGDLADNVREEPTINIGL